jgi:hypothetical protein
MAGNTHSARAKLASAERAKQVLESRLRGCSFETIGRQLGVSTSGACKIYHRQLASIPKPEREELKRAQKERLDRARDGNMSRYPPYD